MSHSHHHHHGHSDHSDVKNIRTAFFLNISFTLIEIVGGIYTNSIAILSDAVHDLGDSLSLGLAWYFQKIAKKKRDATFSYGYKRFSLLGAIVNSVVLLVGSIFILTEAIPRLIHPQETHAGGMFILAIFGVLVNGLAVFKLRKGQSINERVVSLHMLEDVLGWAAVLVGSIVMYFFDLPIIDPILSVGIATFILVNVFKNIKETLRIILQGVPEEVDVEHIEQHLKEISDIDSLHDLHIWSIDGSYNILTVHVVLKQELSMQELMLLKTRIRTLMKEEGVQHITVEFEMQDEFCQLENCSDEE